MSKRGSAGGNGRDACLQSILVSILSSLLSIGRIDSIKKAGRKKARSQCLRDATLGGAGTTNIQIEEKRWL
jgi:hypothetical protein